MTRLADALVGFVRDAVYEIGNETKEIKKLFENALKNRTIVEV